MHARLTPTSGRRRALARRPLGRTGLEVSVVGFGAASYWGMRVFSERKAVALVHEAIDRGVNLFDTSPSYSHGHAEQRLGRALAPYRSRDLVVATKVGTRLGPKGRPTKDFSVDTMRGSVEQSLRDLGRDSVPLLFLHGPSVADLGPATVECLHDLRGRGLVQHVGINSFDPAVIAQALDLDVFECLMVDYNILRLEREPLISAWVGAGKGVLAAGALARSLVGNRLLKLREPADLWYLVRALATRRRDVVRGLRYRFVGREPGWSPSEVALSFVLANSGISSALIGTTRTSHLVENLEAAERPIPSSLEQRIRAVWARN